MIDFYAWYTSNARKIAIMLEEAALDYETHIVDIGRGQQFEPDFLSISPNNKIPVIVDQEGPDGTPHAVFESGAILIYLAEKSGRFLPESGTARSEVMQWLMFQMASIGPMFGQCNHFRRYARDNIPYAIDRYTNECKRLYWVMEKHLRDREYVAGDYTIADMALMPWMRSFDWRDQDPDAVPNVKAWVARIEARPAVQRAMAMLAHGPRSGPIDADHWENMYGDTQYRQR